MRVTKHFPIEQLLDFAEGMLTTGDSANIQNHLENCSKCQTDLDSVAAVTKILRSGNMADAPVDSVKWAKNLFKSRPEPVTSSLIQRIFGILKVDLGLDSPVYAERSGTAGVRQMLYESDSGTVDLRVSKSGMHSELAGQILGDDFGGCEVSLRRTGKFLTSKINELNEFRFSGLESGNYEMSIKKDRIELILQDLEF